MSRFFACLIFVTMQLTVIGQIKKQIPTNEMDRLFEQFKGIDTLEVTTIYGLFLAKTEVHFNDAGKVAAIILKGGNTNVAAIRSFLEGFKQKKLKQGYYRTHSYDPNIETFAKGKIYIKVAYKLYYGYWDNAHSSSIPDSAEFEITQEDITREGGSKKDVDF